MQHKPLEIVSTPSPKVKPRRTACQWQDIMNDYEGSGLSQQEYCQRLKLDKTKTGQALLLSQFSTIAVPVHVIFVVNPIINMGINAGGSLNAQCSSCRCGDDKS